MDGHAWPLVAAAGWRVPGERDPAAAMQRQPKTLVRPRGQSPTSIRSTRLISGAEAAAPASSGSSDGDAKPQDLAPVRGRQPQDRRRRASTAGAQTTSARSMSPRRIELFQHPAANDLGRARNGHQSSVHPHHPDTKLEPHFGSPKPQNSIHWKRADARVAEGVHRRGPGPAPDGREDDQGTPHERRGKPCPSRRAGEASPQRARAVAPLGAGAASAPALWEGVDDEKLLDMRLCGPDLRLMWARCWSGRIDSQHAERARGLTFRPHFWLLRRVVLPGQRAGHRASRSTSRHPRLARLEQHQMLEVEGGTPEWCTQASSATRRDTRSRTRYRHRQRRDSRRALFGRSTQRYPQYYTPKPVQQELRASIRRLVRAEPSRTRTSRRPSRCG